MLTIHMLSQDINTIASMQVLGKYANVTFLSLLPVFAVSLSQDQVTEIPASQALPVYMFTPDTTSPSVVSFDSLMPNQRLPPQLVLRFTKFVAAQAVHP